MTDKNSVPNGPKDSTYVTSTRVKRLTARLEFHRKRALSYGNKADIIDPLEVFKIYEEFGYKCAYCQRENQYLQIDHIRAISQKGTHTLQNLLPCCSRCNRSKTNLEMIKWYKSQSFFCPERLGKIFKVHKISSTRNIYSTKEKALLAEKAQRICRSKKGNCLVLQKFDKYMPECESCRAKRILTSLEKSDSKNQRKQL
jgi:hypothetical protein